MPNKLTDIMERKSSLRNTPMGSIFEFYEGVNILLTGATGFVGKVVLEKLLRSCNASGNIYLLIRPKKGLKAEERLDQLFESPIFNKLRKEDPFAFNKVKLIPGDLEEPNFGFGDLEREVITENVNIVLHSAANVKFVQSLQDAVRTNTISAKRMIELCRDIKHLQSFVYVSTTFSDRREVEEIVYETPYDPNFIIDCVEKFPASTINLMTKSLLGNHPNTYTFSKALAEKIVLEASESLPTIIVRPSIVHSSWKEPFPGWVDSLGSFTPLVGFFNLGVLKSLNCDKKVITDIIPVDVVANTIITAPWYAHINKSAKPRVYNCASGTINGITYETFVNLLQKYIVKYPSKLVQSYPNLELVKNKEVHQVNHFIYHFMPAFIYDVYLLCTIRKSSMVRKCKKMAEISKAYVFATTECRNFHTENFKELIAAVSKAEDGKNFNIDMRKENGFNWASYIKDYQLGMRQFILKDDNASLNYAKTKLNWIYWTVKANQFVFLCLLLAFILRQKSQSIKFLRYFIFKQFRTITSLGVKVLAN